MNLFCFSLEGSMDSLYEPVQDPHDTQECSIPSRPCSPAMVSQPAWHSSERSIPAELSQSHSHDFKKKKRKTPIRRSESDNEILDNTDCYNVLRQSSRKKEDVSNVKTYQPEEMVEDFLLGDFLSAGDRVHLLRDQWTKDSSPQIVTYEAWIPSWEQSDIGHLQQDMLGETEDEGAESKGTLRRLQRLVGVKKGCRSGAEEGRSVDTAGAPVQDMVLLDDSPVISCIKLPRNPERKPSKEVQQPVQQSGSSTDQSWGSAQWPGRSHWGGPGERPPPWDRAYHTCHRPLPDHRLYGLDFTLPRAKDWDRLEYCGHGRSPPRFARSATDVDLRDAQRSSSFGRFDAFRHQSSPVKPEENAETEPTEGEAAAESCDQNQNKTGSLGKKMRAISMTMRKKMGKKYVKALSEEMGDGADREHEGNAETSHPMEKGPGTTNGSAESLYSLKSGQSSSSGVTSGSDGSSNRDSLRLEEEIPYTGPFCGRARVHTDFIPSPYDTDSLKLKAGDIIDVISKPPMGIWTGMLNNKVGNFKFIYVDVLIDVEVEPRKIRPHRRSKRPRPRTLQELLERINLEEYASSLLLNGYETVEDLKDLKENHLVELNVSDPEHRARLLAATEFLLDLESENEQESRDLQASHSQSNCLKVDQDHPNECPRDSGCYITSESSDNSKDDVGSESHPETVEIPPSVS
ncbi:SAM and SH3 domain-containing protein 1 [Lepisosteus oculatus]|uniref:SAM and SH3 domain-containing protein 1 n=1 Tax=Lepisosteus oculatus TaxID=7918 RepID=UPI00371C56D1